MKNNQEKYLPKKRPSAPVGHLAIAAHPDDAEILAFSGISACYDNPKEAFAAVITADGAGGAISGEYGGFTAEQMTKIRANEQKQAADIGRYQELYLLNYPSSQIQDPLDTEIIKDYLKILNSTKPHIVYTHNPADKHPTHLGVAVKTIKAIRTMDKPTRPQKLLGVEVWRSLDWLNDERKVLLDCSAHPDLERELLGAFDSQIAGGKRYDLAVPSRRLANATFFESHTPDRFQKLNFAMDLTPLILDDNLDIVDYILTFIDDFKKSVQDSLKKILE
ncbi:MAG TPA: PIG-L family deacetylase [Clostridiales bacterium]|nr:PIG-L family deacetylase [Clostridiales bacterium]